MNQDRVAAVADAIAELGFNGNVAFDRYEPEYDTIERFQSTFDNQKFVDLLLICATTADYYYQRFSSARVQPHRKVVPTHQWLDQ